jgi:hypothetical protein
MPEPSAGCAGAALGRPVSASSGIGVVRPMSDALKDRVRALDAAVKVGDLATVEVVYDPGLRTWAPPDDQLQPDPAHLVGVLHRPQPLAQRTMPSTWAR